MSDVRARKNGRAGRIRTLIAGLLGALLVVSGVGATAQAAATVTFTDPQLRAAVNEALGNDPDAPVDAAAAASLTELYAAYRSPAITRLGGIAALSGLHDLSLDGNAIADISPLAALTSLTTASVTGQSITLDSIETGVWQASPIRGLSGAVVAPQDPGYWGLTVDTAGKRWQATQAGYYSVPWSVTAGAVAYSGYVSQEATGDAVLPPGTVAKPTIGGPLSVGSTVTAAVVVDPNYDWQTTYAYQWLADNATIPGATAKTLAIAAAQAGARLSVRVTVSIPDYRPVTVVSDQTAKVVTAGTPTVTGTLRAGEVLTASPGTWDPPAAFAYQWLAGGTAISGANATTFTLTTAQEGKRISVRVTGTPAAGFATVTKTSAETSPVLRPLVKTPVPTISGTLAVGSTVKAVPGTWDSGATLAYQWYANGAAILGATTSKLVLTTAHKDKVLTVKVTGSKPDYIPATKTSKASLKVIFATTPKISGKIALGVKLTVTRGTWTRDTVFSYRWYASGAAIPGATKSSLTIDTPLQGKSIKVKVTGKKAGYAIVAKTSAGSAKVSLMNTSSKASVASAYKRILAPAERTSVGWTGRISTCTPGTEASRSKRATLNAVNFYRALVQLDGVRFADKWNSQAMRNSLLMAARGQITHYPSKSGKCWSQAAYDAASTSNLFIAWGYSGLSPATGARAISGYMDDSDGNNILVGHRRWILYPPTSIMGTASTNSTNTLKVIGTSTAKTFASPTWMEWPSAGYFPTQLEPQGRWSLSASSSSVDFSSAKISVKGPGGKSLKVTKYPVTDGYGPNTVSWQVAGVAAPSGSAVRSYTVTVSGIEGATASRYSYTVKIFRP
ncbi:CAP domain-containing protein [Microbacterium terricola]|uniref:SCP domain-containing protein n=1 Tax=Microbacterium terricola TaxID=344163 RepID=A0ABM8E2V9_9MICO|nr:CAP domain-containing protein [Microbacterium terricola]UYK40185.1 CAP domain-containing protein [Microbacterium terricola]BDV32109.1 hypothetical protein Microterr_27690 [Microbacterium terricola]